jgi:hypothetical protein
MRKADIPIPLGALLIPNGEIPGGKEKALDEPNAGYI